MTEKYVYNFNEGKKEMKEAVTAIGKVEKQKVSDFLKNMYEVSPQNVKEQIAIYEEKEMSQNDWKNNCSSH